MHIATDVKYSSFKTEDSLLLGNGALSDGPVPNSCICKSKYDVASYRKKAPYLSHDEKVDLIKNVFLFAKNIHFPETIRSFKFSY